jgi:hypothetical protein
MIDLDRMMTRLPEQAADAIVGMLRPRSRTLASYLRSVWGAPAGSPGSLIAEPFLEGAFPWLPLKGGWSGLEQGMFDRRSIDVLKSVSYPPYAHQVEAWKHLTEPPRVCRRLQLLRGWSHDKQDDEQVFG